MPQPPTEKMPPEQDHASDQADADDALDEALKESFPASDPVAIAIEHPAKALEGP